MVSHSVRQWRSNGSKNHGTGWTVQVPADFDPDECDLGNGLAELSNDGFQWLDRCQIVVLDADPDPAAEFFDPPRHDSEGASA